MTVPNDILIGEEDIPFYAALIDFSYRRAPTDYRLKPVLRVQPLPIYPFSRAI